MKPIKKVTDPHNINETDIPSISQANPAGDIVFVDKYWGWDLHPGTGVWSVKGIGGDRIRFRTSTDSSWKTLDCWSWCRWFSPCLLIILFLRQNPTENWKMKIFLNPIIRRKNQKDLRYFFLKTRRMDKPRDSYQNHCLIGEYSTTGEFW